MFYTKIANKWLLFLGETPYNGPEWLPNYLQKLNTGLRLERPTLANSDMYVIFL